MSVEYKVLQDDVGSKFPFFRSFVYSIPGHVILPQAYIDNGFHEKIASFQARPDDVYVVTYPKSGTTWTQEMLWCIIHGLDHQDLNEELLKRSPFLEWDGLFPTVDTADKEHPYPETSHVAPGAQWKLVNTLPSPRLIKTHLPLCLLPKSIWDVGAKIVYVARNPKDVAVSYYHHMKGLDGFMGDFDEAVQYIMDGKVAWSPFWGHVLDFWNIRQNKNVCFFTYEQMKKDLPAIIDKVAAFLGKSLQDDQVKRLVDHLSFSNMKSNDSVNYSCMLKVLRSLESHKECAKDYSFIRSGKTGGWKAYFSPELLERFESWIDEHLKDAELRELIQC